MLIVAEPNGRIPFVNVSWAGFIGSVTGMNARHISIGEMGGAAKGIGRRADVVPGARCARKAANSTRPWQSSATIREPVNIST